MYIMQYYNLIECFDAPVEEMSNQNANQNTNPNLHYLKPHNPNITNQTNTKHISKKIKQPQIKIPKPPKTKPSKYNPPVQLPHGISHDNWWPWWKKNRWYYGDRDYYLELGYPLWWIDYYYPEWDYDYYPDTIYTQPTIIAQSTEPQSSSQPIGSIVISPTVFVIFMIFIFLILIMFLFITKKN